MESRENLEQNWQAAVRLAEEAVSRGARIVAFPEVFLYVGPDKSISFDLDGVWLPKFSALASRLGIYLLAGSIGERIPNSKKVYNTSVLLHPDGKELARYRKIHLFDAVLADGRSYRESDYIAPGSEVVVARTEFGNVGLSVCYDLRFPELYRKLTADASSTRLIFIPSNFTLMTGKDHWLPLLRARAIENQVYIIAPNQHGEKYGGRASYGKSAIIDPWGSVLAIAPDREAVVTAEIDFDYQDKVRAALPCLSHVRLL
jgi:predicted amidohydrolase